MKFIILFSLILILSLFLGCASTTPPAIFLPQQNSQVFSFYRNGLPIGVFSVDSSFVMVSIESTVISNATYMRLWFLYRNNSSVPFLLEPLKAVKLSIFRGNKLYDEITPESPAKILADIENEKAVSLIMQTIGGTLQAMATQPTSISNRNGQEWKANDRSEKVEKITDKMMVNISNTTFLLYNIFKSSINNGIIRRNTIFPGESINGYIYFPLPMIDKFSGKGSINPSEYQYKLFISTQYREKIIDFIPMVGE